MQTTNTASLYTGLLVLQLKIANEELGCRSSSFVHSLQDRGHLEEVEGDPMRCL